MLPIGPLVRVWQARAAAGDSRSRCPQKQTLRSLALLHPEGTYASPTQPVLENRSNPSPAATLPPPPPPSPSVRETPVGTLLSLAPRGKARKGGPFADPSRETESKRQSGSRTGRRWGKRKASAVPWAAHRQTPTFRPDPTLCERPTAKGPSRTKQIRLSLLISTTSLGASPKGTISRSPGTLVSHTHPRSNSSRKRIGRTTVEGESY